MNSISVRVAKKYLSLRPVPVPDYQSTPQRLKRPLMEYESETNKQDAFLDFFPGLTPLRKDVLDVGCGFGGRAVRFAELGANSVTGIEYQDYMMEEAREFAISKGQKVTFLHGVAENMPFPDNSFDHVYSYDVFEHVSNVEESIRECHRVLRPGGSLYCIFPPFYHPTGGSHLHGYISSSPAANVLFSCKTLRRAVEELMSERGDTWRPVGREGDPLPMMNGVTFAQAKRIIKRIPFSKRKVGDPPIRSNRAWFLNPVFSIGSKIPILREVCIERIVATLTK